jgi:hypothetical protein
MMAIFMVVSFRAQTVSTGELREGGHGLLGPMAE